MLMSHWADLQQPGEISLGPTLVTGFGKGDFFSKPLPGLWAMAPSLGEVCGGPGAKEVQEEVCRLLPFIEGKWDISWSSTEVRA